MASPPCPPAAAGGHGGEAIRQPSSSRSPRRAVRGELITSSRIPRRAVRGELITIESQNSLRINRGLLHTHAYVSTYVRIGTRAYRGARDVRVPAYATTYGNKRFTSCMPCALLCIVNLQLNLNSDHLSTKSQHHEIPPKSCT